MINLLFSPICQLIQNTDCKELKFRSYETLPLIRLIFGLENGLVVVDYHSQFILMNLATGDLYGTSDPFQRTALSPKRRGPSNESNNDDSNIFSYEYQVKKISSILSIRSSSSPSVIVIRIFHLASIINT